jgi:hypothetical protein
LEMGIAVPLVGMSSEDSPAVEKNAPCEPRSKREPC